MTHNTTAPGASGPPDTEGPEPTDSRPRRIAFRVLSTVLLLWLLALSVFGLAEVVVMWLPAATVAEMVPDDDVTNTIEHHRTHIYAVGLVAWATVLSAAVQLRRPERRAAPMLLLLVSATTSLGLFGLSGTVAAWLLEEWSWFVPVVVLAVLHPARRTLGRWPGHDRRQLGLAAVAAVPWLAYAVVNASRQVTRSGEHANGEHWAIAAWLGVVVVAAALLGASRHHGWRLPAWYAAIASVLLGAHALVHPDFASALWTPFAIGAIGWGIVYAAAIVARTRTAEPA